MAFDAYLRLSELLLRQSDRHPIRALSGEDLSGISAAAVSEFEQQGLIVRERDLGDADGVVFHQVGDEVCVATSYEDGAVEPVLPLALATYRIEYLRIARLLRNRFALDGPPVEALSHKVHALGVRHSGRRRQQVYLVRCLRPASALETLFVVRAHAASDANVVVLTATKHELPRAVLRQVDGFQVFAIASLLKRQAIPFAVKYPAFSNAPAAAVTRARLVIDTGGHVARLDGKELSLQPRDFQVLLLLANEAKQDGGFVPNERLDETLRQATGSDGYEEQVTKSIDRIRKLLTKIDRALQIETRRGVGRRLIVLSRDIEVL